MSVDHIVNDADPGGPQPELSLAIPRQCLFAHTGIINPIPYPVLEAISEEPIFCSASTVNNAVDLAHIHTMLLVTTGDGMIRTNPNGRLGDSKTVDISISSQDRPLLAAIRDSICKDLGLADDEPRRPNVVALLHDANIPGLAKAAVLIYHWLERAPSSQGMWKKADDIHPDDRFWLPALPTGPNPA